MAKIETHFIGQNKILDPKGYIGIYDGSRLVGIISANRLWRPNLGEKRGSVGVLSDVHVDGTSNTACERFARALDFFVKSGVDFTVVAGDITNHGTADEYEVYRGLVQKHSPDTPVYAITGNHDCDKVSLAPYETQNSTTPYTGHELYYDVEFLDCVFLMVGMRGWPGYTGEIFTTGELDWMLDTLNRNQDKRCIVVSHVPYMEYANGLCVRATSGALVGLPLPTGNLLSGQTGSIFKSYLEGRSNVMWLHGHSHMEFTYQADQDHVIYDTKNTAFEFGRHSIHIPSSATGRVRKDDGWTGNDAKSGGYIMEIYDHHIVMRGLSFATEKVVGDPMATYVLEF